MITAPCVTDYGNWKLFFPYYFILPLIFFFLLEQSELGVVCYKDERSV